MDIERLTAQLQREISPGLFEHCRGVAATAAHLAELNPVVPGAIREDRDRAYVAGLLHDCAREYSDEQLRDLIAHYSISLDDHERQLPSLWHGRVGSFLVRDRYGIDDEKIRNAVYWHTTGRGPGTTGCQADPDVLTVILYLADFIEPGRTTAGWGPGATGLDQIRALAEQDLYRATLMAIDHKLEHIREGNRPVHPDTMIFRTHIEDRFQK